MRYQRVTLILIILLAASVNAATNIAPVLHPPWCQTKTMHSGNDILPRGHLKGLRGGANSPPMQPSLHRQNSHQTWCYAVRTQHHQPITPSAETIQTEGRHHEWGNRIVIASARETDDDINFFGGLQKTVAGSYMRVTMGDLMVWALKLDPDLHQNTIGKHSSRAFDWCNKNVLVQLWNDT